MTLGAVSTSTAGAKTLVLGAGGAGSTIAGNITNGNGTIAVTKSSSGTWSLSGTNTYTGNTTIGNDSGTIATLGKPALSPNTLISAGRNATLSLRMDDAGTANTRTGPGQNGTATPPASPQGATGNPGGLGEAGL